MKNRIKLLTIVTVALGVSLTALASGTMSPLGIDPVPNPPGSLAVTIGTDRAVYALNQSVIITFTVNQPAYVYVYNIQADGVVRLVFPNAYSQNNYVMPGRHVLPDGSHYRFQATEPVGLEHLQIFASPFPLSLSPGFYSEPFPQATPQGIQGRILGITPTPTPSWVTAWTSFTITYPTYGYTPPYTPGYPPNPPSFPPFFGWMFPCGSGTWYWEDGQWRYGCSDSGFYWYYSSDGKWHFGIRIRIGP